MILLLISTLAFANSCPARNLKACQAYLKSEYEKKNNADFVEKYNEICAQNKTFSCIKITVRDDVNEVMKEQTKIRGPYAALFSVTSNEENYIYILTKK